MYSIMMTGYMFQNAQYRLELQQSLEPVALPEGQDKKVPSFSFPFLVMNFLWSLNKTFCSFAISSVAEEKGYGDNT